MLRIRFDWLALAALTLLLAACGGGMTTPAENPTATGVPFMQDMHEEPVIQTALATIEPAPTPVPPTNTVEVLKEGLPAFAGCTAEDYQSMGGEVFGNGSTIVVRSWAAPEAKPDIFTLKLDFTQPKIDRNEAAEASYLKVNWAGEGNTSGGSLTATPVKCNAQSEMQAFFELVWHSDEGKDVLVGYMGVFVSTPGVPFDWNVRFIPPSNGLMQMIQNPYAGYSCIWKVTCPKSF